MKLVYFVCPKCSLRLKVRPKDFPIVCHCGARVERAAGPAANSPTNRTIDWQDGPGTELKLLLSELGITDKIGCDCESVRREMNRLGVDGCRRERERLLTRLSENARKYGWLAKMKAAGAAVANGMAFRISPTAPLRSLFDLAVSRAEEKLAALPLLADIREPWKPRASDWHLRPDVAAAHQLLLDRVASASHQSPEWFDGRGIVTLGGTAKYFGAAWVLVSLLRKLDCTLPVEWWHFGRSEMDARMIRLAESLGNVQCVDLHERLGAHGRYPRRLAGWEAKVWAVMFSRFREVLWLDADNVPTRDPSYLFDDPRYRQAGAVFWPDFPPMGWSITPLAFDVTRLAVPGNTKRLDWRNPTDYRPFETGQILIDKPRHWRQLELTAAICDHSDFFFPHEHRGKADWLIYGDKDAFYLAWARLGGYAMPPESADVSFAGNAVAGAFMQCDFDGKLLFQHRVQPAVKWRLHGENKEVAGSLHHQQCVDALSELRGKWCGNVYEPADETAEERRIAAGTFGRKVWFKPGGDEMLTLGPDGKTGTQEWHWTVRGQYLILATFDRMVAELGRDDKGNWCNHGTRNFLMDAPPEHFDVPIEPMEVVIWHEVVRDNEYRLPDRFDQADVILDIGGHLGLFAWACLSRGAGKVISVEPHPDNFRRLESNLASFAERSQRINAAAWSRADSLLLTQPEGARHTGGWCAIGTTEGVSATAVPFDSLVTQRLRLVKLDCEGSEWPILASCRTFHLIDAWCGEYHQTPHAEAAARLRAILEPHGYVVSTEPHPKEDKLGHFWATKQLTASPSPASCRR